MDCNRLTKMLLAGFLAFSLTVTSLGGAFAVSASAADVSGSTGQRYGNGSYLGGLLALGLVAILSNGYHAKQNVVWASKSTLGSYSSAAQATTPAPAGGQSSTSLNLSAAEAQALSLLNADRAANGLAPLQADRRLSQLAGAYAQDMINRDFFAHNDPDGRSPFDRMRAAGVTYRYAGENLAINVSVPGAEKAFMNSPGHRANILNANYKRVGIGVRSNSRGSVYVVQEFTD